MIKWKAAVYLRLSVDDGQKAESNSISNQKELINSYIKKEKDIKVIDYYIDDGYTGTSFDRPGFQRLLLDMKDNKINTVIVKDLSRLGRNYVEVGNYMEQIFPLYKIRFIAINDNIDSFKEPKSADNIIVPIKNLMNDEYARDISNKVRSTLNTKKEKGEFIGSVAPYGYLKDPNNKYKFVIDPYASKIVKKIFSMILKGHSKNYIIDELNKIGVLPPRLYQMKDKKYKFQITENMKIWDRFKIDKILKNRVYIGELAQSKKKTISHKVHKIIENTSGNWIVIKENHESIIKKEDFEQVQNVIYGRDIRINNEKKYDIFSGHIRCGECKNTFTKMKVGKYEYYYCSSHVRKKKCLMKDSIRKEELNKIILEAINLQIDLVLDLDKKIDSIVYLEEINYDMEILKYRIKDINNKITKYEKLKYDIESDYNNKIIIKEDYIEYKTEYDNYLKQYKIDKEIINNKISSINKNNFKNKSWINKFKEYNRIKKLNKTVINELIEDVYIYINNNIKIVFKYEDEYNEALSFINEHQCDIICKELEANEKENKSILMLNIV